MKCVKQDKCLFYSKYQESDNQQYQNLIEGFCNGEHPEECTRQGMDEEFGLHKIDGFKNMSRNLNPVEKKMEFKQWDYRRR